MGVQVASAQVGEAYWKLNDGASGTSTVNTAIDSSGNGNTLNL